MKINGNAIKVGNIVEHQGKLWRAVKTMHTHFPDGRGLVLKRFRESKALTIRREAYPVRSARDSNQLTRACAVGIRQVDVRAVCKGELLSISRPDGGVPDSVAGHHPAPGTA